MSNTKNILLLDRYIIERVFQLRKEKRISIKDIAELLNVEESFVRKIETYRNKYNIHHLFLLASYFEVSVNDFFPNKNNFEEIIFSKYYHSFEQMYNDIKKEIENKRSE